MNYLDLDNSKYNSIETFFETRQTVSAPVWRIQVICSLIMVALAPLVAMATDIGAPPLSQSAENPFSFSLVYDKSSRDIQGGGDIASEVDDQRVMGRLTYQPVGNASFFAQAGTVEYQRSKSQTSDSGTIIGIGANYIVYEKDAFRGSVFGNVNFATGMKETKTRWNTPSLNRAFFTMTSDDIEYNEYVVGLEFGKKITLEQEFVVTPYGGVMISIIDGEIGTVTLSSINTHDEVISGADLEEDGSFIAFGGLEFDLSQTMSFRVEGHILDQAGLSVAGSISF